MTFITSAHVLPVRKVTVNDESSDDFKADTFHMKLQAVQYALQHDHWNKTLHPTTKIKHRKKVLFDHTFCRHFKPHPKQVGIV